MILTRELNGFHVDVVSAVHLDRSMTATLSPFFLSRFRVVVFEFASVVIIMT